MTANTVDPPVTQVLATAELSDLNYPPSGVKLRPSERRHKPYIVILLVRYRLDHFPADLLFVI
jgi:hypothetical protein